MVVQEQARVSRASGCTIRFSLSLRDVQELLWHLDRVFVKIWGQAALSVAGRGSGPGLDRYPGSETPQSPCGKTVLLRASEGAGKQALAAGDGQAEEVWSRPKNLLPCVDHNTDGYADNLAEVSHLTPAKYATRESSPLAPLLSD